MEATRFSLRKPTKTPKSAVFLLQANEIHHFIFIEYKILIYTFPSSSSSSRTTNVSFLEATIQFRRVI